MLALLLQRRLERYWKSLNITVKEGLDELSTLSVHRVVLRDTTINIVPDPSDLSQELLRLANIEIPHALPSFESKIATKKKLGK